MRSTSTDAPALAPGRPAARAPRSPVDLLLGLGGLFLVFVVLVLVSDVMAEGGPTDDASQLRAVIPAGVLLFTALGANLLLIILVAYVILRTLIVGDLRALLRAIVSAVSAYATTSWVNDVFRTATLDTEPLPDLPDGVLTAATLGYVAAGIAFARTMPAGQPRVRSLIWAVNAVIAVTAIMAGVSSVLAVLFTVLIGLTCASLARFVISASVPPPATDRMHDELRRFDLNADRIVRAGIDEDGEPRYLADLDDGRRIEICVFSSENTSGFWWRLRDLLFLRGPVAPRVLYKVRSRAEHAALMSAAVRDAGVCAPRVLALGELAPGTILLAREDSRIRGLDTLEPERITDAFLDDLWHLLGSLHRRRIAHGDLHGSTVGVREGESERGSVATLTGFDHGSVAATPLRTSLDVAALLTLSALCVGVERAVDSAVRALGVDATAAVLPLLQPPGLPHRLRSEVRRTDRELLSRLRRHLTTIAPEAPAEPARLERMRPRTIVSVVVATAVGLVLVYQLAGVDLATIGDADPGWALLAFAMATLCMLAAAMVLVGFVPSPLPWWRTVMVQYAASFVRIAAPAGLGSIAINSRFVIKTGVPTSLALSAVGLTQLVGFLIHVPLLLVCAYLTGTSYWTGFTPSPTVVVIILVSTAIVAAVLLHPRMRRAVGGRLRPYLRGTLPQLLDLFQRPVSLLLGVGGTLLLTVGFILCLHFSVLAFAGPEHQVALIAVAVVFLAGNAIGSTAPTPGGLGAVEAALIGGLAAVAGVPAAVALPAVLLFRALTFWLPVLPGWAAFGYLQRREAI